MSLTALIFFLIFILGCLLTVFRSPFYGILLYEFVYFLNPTNRWWYAGLPDLRYSYIVVVLLLVSFFLHRQFFSGNRLADLSTFKWLVLLAGIVACAGFWAVSPAAHKIEATRFFKVLVFAVLAYKALDSSKKLETALYVYLAGIFYISWYGWQIGRTSGIRLEGIGGPDTLDANGAAAIVVTAVPLLIFQTLYGKHILMRVGSAVALAFVGNCLVLLNSRAAFLALVISMAYFGFFLLRERVAAGVKIKFMLGAGGVACLFAYLADEAFWNRMETLKDVDPETGSGQRYLLWLKSFDMLADHPLGAGGGGYQFLSPYYLPAEWLSGGQRAVHSIWFQVLSDFGYQGLTVFVGFVLSGFFLMWSLRKALRLARDDRSLVEGIALESSYVSLLTACSFISLFTGELVYWLPFFMGAFVRTRQLPPSPLLAGGGAGGS